MQGFSTVGSMFLMKDDVEITLINEKTSCTKTTVDCIVYVILRSYLYLINNIAWHLTLPFFGINISYNL